MAFFNTATIVTRDDVQVGVMYEALEPTRRFTLAVPARLSLACTEYQDDVGCTSEVMSTVKNTKSSTANKFKLLQRKLTEPTSRPF